MSEPEHRQRRQAAHYVVLADAEGLGSTAELVATSLDFPVAQINVLDDRRHYRLGAYGIDTGETPRDESMCQFVVESGRVIVTNEPQNDVRFAQLPAVRDGFVGTYVGVPISGRESSFVGTLCVLDPASREVGDADVARLEGFARLVEDQLEVLRRDREQDRSGRPDVGELATALHRHEVVPWYQPVVDLASGRPYALEALARWQQPGRSEPVVPNVQRAEDSDLIIDLDRTVLEQAFVDMGRWRAAGSSLRLNVNLSTRQLELPETADVVRVAAARGGVDPHTVTLEITETRELTSLEGASDAVSALRRQGFAVALDDFGKGWSSLDWLLAIDVDGIKVDGLIAAALDRRVGAATCRALIGIAEEMNLSTTLEGIGAPWQRDRALEVGFRYGQGYLWSPAVPAALVDPGV